jgi:hypothetical protein
MYGFIDLFILLLLIFLYIKKAVKLKKNKILWFFMAVIGFTVGYAFQFFLIIILDNMSLYDEAAAWIFAIGFPLCELIGGLVLLHLLARYHKRRTAKM